MQVHKKLIYNRELQFWQRLQKTDIVPLVLSIQPMGSSQYLLSTKRYPMTLQAWMCDHASDQKYLCKLPALVNKLHKRGIIHGDLTLDNVVIDSKTGDLRLIDFDLGDWL